MGWSAYNVQIDTMFLQAVEDVFQSTPFAKIIIALDNALIVTKALQLLMANVSLRRQWIPTANREMGRDV